MKKATLLLLASLLMPSASSLAQEYKQVWSEEFDNVGAVDEKTWNFDTGKFYNQELETYSRDNAVVGLAPDGKTTALVITAKPDFTSARLQSQNNVTFKYGKLEASIMLPKTANGLWPAFWLMGNQGEWPACGEIDVMEMGHSNGISQGTTEKYHSGACHWGPSQAQHQYYDKFRNAPYSLEDGQFHKYILEWTPEVINMYLDDETTPYYTLDIKDKSSETSAGNYFHQEFYVLLNLAIGGSYTGITWNDGITALQSGEQKMYVDYVRLYQKEGEEYYTINGREVHNLKDNTSGESGETGETEKAEKRYYKLTYQIGDGEEIYKEGFGEGIVNFLGDDAMKVTKLKFDGDVNDDSWLTAADIKGLRRMAGGNEQGESTSEGALKNLDLSIAKFHVYTDGSYSNQFLTVGGNDVTITEGKALPSYMFYGCSRLENVTLGTQCNTVNQYVFGKCANLSKVDIPSNVTAIDKGAFSGDANLTEVTVHGSSQIDARWYEGDENIFSGVNANQVRLVFEGTAEANYWNYRNNIVKDNQDYGKNAFMYLLTKTLDENETTYNVVAQRHADVQLHRTFKAGWNTLVLPFGGISDYPDWMTKCSRIYQKALNPTNNADFMIAAYRGLRKNEAHPDESTFYFLKYANYDVDPLDDYEPLLIRMTQQDIDASQGVYTFQDVHVNYDSALGWDTYYTPEQAQARMGTNVSKSGNGTYESLFDGNYDHDANDKFRSCTYDDYYFTGTLQLQQGEAMEGSTFIAPGDYIIQDNTFVKCFAGKKYGMKGFRGYFKQKSSSNHAAKENIAFNVVDWMGETTAIDYLDGEYVGKQPANIYNLNGQLVGRDSSLLTKGIYVKNGRKFIVK